MCGPAPGFGARRRRSVAVAPGQALAEERVENLGGDTESLPFLGREAVLVAAIGRCRGGRTGREEAGDEKTGEHDGNTTEHMDVPTVSGDCVRCHLPGAAGPESCDSSGRCCERTSGTAVLP